MQCRLVRTNLFKKASAGTEMIGTYESVTIHTSWFRYTTVTGFQMRCALIGAWRCSAAKRQTAFTSMVDSDPMHRKARATRREKLLLNIMMYIHVHECSDIRVHVHTMFRHVCTVLPYPCRGLVWVTPSL
jgi:hypothetical protein